MDDRFLANACAVTCALVTVLSSSESNAGLLDRSFLSPSVCSLRVLLLDRSVVASLVCLCVVNLTVDSIIFDEDDDVIIDCAAVDSCTLVSVGLVFS